MTETDYLEEVKKTIAKQFQLDQESIEDDSFLEADLNITELDLEDLVSSLEDKYQISIPPSLYTNFKQVSDIANYLYENVEQV